MCVPHPTGPELVVVAIAPALPSLYVCHQDVWSGRLAQWIERVLPKVKVQGSTP